MIFNLPPILGLLPLVVYIVLAFNKKIHSMVNVTICILIGMFLTKTNPLTFGSIMIESLGSFLGKVGLIIMMGSGLGLVLKESGIAENLVYIIVRKIGVNNMRKAILASMFSSMVMVLLLSTLTGGNAVIAPILIPLVASVGMTPSTLAIIMQTAGVTGLFISPFSPPMVTIMELTGMTYGQVLLHASLPICIPMWIICYWNAMRVNKRLHGVYDYPEGTALDVTDYKATPETKSATNLFAIVVLVIVVYGIMTNAGMNNAITVIVGGFLAASFGAKFSAKKSIDTFMKGCGQYIWVFILFLLFDPFLNLIAKSGAYDALVDLLTPLIDSTGKVGLAMLTTLIGVYGIQGAAVAQAVMIDQVFRPLVDSIGLSINVWALVILVGSQMTSFAYPGLDMIAAVGTARSDDMKTHIQHGVIITGAALIVTFVFTVLFG